MQSVLYHLIQHPSFPKDLWQHRRYAEHELIIRQGECSGNLYLVLSGSVRVMGNVLLDGQRRVQPGFGDLGTGEVFGELALFDDLPHSASVMAITDCEIAVIDGKRLLSHLDQHPQQGYSVLKNLGCTMVQRLRKTNDKLFSVFAWGLKAHGIDKHL